MLTKPAGNVVVAAALEAGRADIATTERAAFGDSDAHIRVPDRPAATVVLKIKPELQRRDRGVLTGVCGGVEVSAVQGCARAEASNHAKHPAKAIDAEVRFGNLQEAVGQVKEGRVEGVNQLAVVTPARDTVRL